MNEYIEGEGAQRSGRSTEKNPSQKAKTLKITA
jgi:hypothetical protein